MLEISSLGPAYHTSIFFLVRFRTKKIFFVSRSGPYTGMIMFFKKIIRTFWKILTVRFFFRFKICHCEEKNTILALFEFLSRYLPWGVNFRFNAHFLLKHFGKYTRSFFSNRLTSCFFFCFEYPRIVTLHEFVRIFISKSRFLLF